MKKAQTSIEDQRLQRGNATREARQKHEEQAQTLKTTPAMVVPVFLTRGVILPVFSRKALLQRRPCQVRGEEKQAKKEQHEPLAQVKCEATLALLQEAQARSNLNLLFC